MIKMRTFLNIIRYLFILICTLTFAAILFFSSDFAKKKLSNTLSESFFQATGQELHIGNIEYLFPNRLHASQVIVGDPQSPLLTLQSVSVVVSLSSFLNWSNIALTLSAQQIHYQNTLVDDFQSSMELFPYQKECLGSLALSGKLLDHPLKASFCFFLDDHYLLLKDLKVTSNQLESQGFISMNFLEQTAKGEFEGNYDHFNFKIRTQMADLFDNPSGNLSCAISDLHETNRTLLVETAFNASTDASPFSLSFTEGKSSSLTASGNWHFAKEGFEIAIASCQGKVSSVPFSLQNPCFIDIQPNFFNVNSLSLKVDQGVLEANANYSKGELHCLGKLNLNTMPAIQWEVGLPFAYSLSPFTLNINPDSPVKGNLSATADLNALLQLFDRDVPEAKGTARLALNLSGTVSKPIITCQGEIAKGSFESLELGSVFQNIQAQFYGDQENIVIKQFSATAGQGGTVSGKGKVRLLNDYAFEAYFAIQNTNLINLDYINGNFNGELALHGSLKGATLKGRMTANSLNILLSEKIPELVQTVEITYINQPANRPPPQSYQSKSNQWPLDLDIDVNIPGNGSISGRDLSSKWKGDIKIKGTTATPLFYGEYKVVQGQYLFNGKPFEINEGTIFLNGEFDKKTSTYIIASKDLDEVKVEVILKGPINQPAITFRSNPPLPQREILSWILFNRGTSEISEFQGTQLNQSITNLSTKQEGPDFLTKIRNTLGVDRIDFGPSNDNSGSFSFQVGKYISKGFYVSVNKSDINRISVEANLLKNVKLQAEVGEDAQGQILLKWKRDY